MKTFAWVLSFLFSIIVFTHGAHGEDGVTADKIIVGASGDPESLSGSLEKLGVNLSLRVHGCRPCTG